MRRWLIAGIIALPLLCLGAGWRYVQVTPESRDEGDSPIFIDVSCDPSIWTAIVSSDTIRRVAFLQIDPQVQSPVCIGTAAAGSSTITCDNTFKGVVLGTANTTTNFTSYTKNAWTCRSVAIVTGVIHGYIGRDKRDIGDVGAADLQ